MSLEAIGDGKVALVTGGASGIGLASARHFAQQGMRVVLVDRDEAKLASAAASLRETTGGRVKPAPLDVADRHAFERLAVEVASEFGPIHVLMNNAGISPETSIFGPRDDWRRLLDVNLWGIINGCQVLGPAMVEHGGPALIINTGSKQGITTPPGNPAYNLSKAGVKVFTESLAHELRSRSACRVSAHLPIPGFVFTGLTARGRAEKPDAAWTPEQTVEFMIASLDRGDFYILCPDNDVQRSTDERRILWGASDIVENRPALSRWHPDHERAFKAFVEG